MLSSLAVSSSWLNRPLPDRVIRKGEVRRDLGRPLRRSPGDVDPRHRGHQRRLLLPAVVGNGYRLLAVTGPQNSSAASLLAKLPRMQATGQAGTAIAQR